ncbi:MAG TPA: hypothetical protein VN618_14965 [Solirubrobacteraceae bacterium]|nr:hypothetical protein [Solirubrobacteraceae bacterium]
MPAIVVALAWAVPASGLQLTPRPFNASLSPPIYAGEAGWCLSVRSGDGGSWSCPVLATEGRPIFDEEWGGSGPPSEVEAFALTTAEVPEVSLLGGPPVPTVAEPSLPYGFRGVAMNGPGTLRDLLAGGPRLFRALGSDGAPLTTLGTPRVPAAYTLATASSGSGVVPVSAPCALSSLHVPGFAFRGVEYVPRLRPLMNLIGRPFLACATAFYRRGSFGVFAAIVLDADRPGRPPAGLTEAKPVAGHPGVVREPGALRIVGRRIPGGWLLVEGGNSQAERLALLGSVRGSVRARAG